jgi:hypothetical protein
MKRTIDFFVELHQIGPFLSHQLMGCALVCLGIYIWQIVRLYKKGSTNSVILSVSLMGIFMALVYEAYLGNLQDMETAILNFKKTTVTILDVGLMGTAVLAFMDWWSNKEK